MAKKRGKMVLFFKKLSRRLKFFLLGNLILLLSIAGGIFWWLKTHPPRAAEIVGVPETLSVITAPEETRHILHTENPARVYVIDNIGLRIFDASNLLQTVQIGEYRSGSADFYGLYVSGDKLYTLQNDRVQILDIANAAAISKVGEIDLQVSSSNRFQVLEFYNNKLYVAGLDGLLKIVNLSSSQVEKTISTVTTGNLGISDLKAKDIAGVVYVFLANGRNGLKILNTATDQIVGIVGFPNDNFPGLNNNFSATALILNGNYAYISTEGGEIG